MLDLDALRVVGWALSATADAALALAALGRALASRRPPRGRTHHCDRGGNADRRALVANGAAASTSRRADCWSDATAESSFAALRAELADYERHPTRAPGGESAGADVDACYNVQRRHSPFDHVRPLAFDLGAKVDAFAASSDCPPKRGKLSRAPPAGGAAAPTGRDGVSSAAPPGVLDGGSRPAGRVV